MSDQNQSERRKHNRVKFNGEMTLRPVVPSKSGNILKVQTHGISTKGCEISEDGIRFKLTNQKLNSELLKVNFTIHKFKSIDAYGKLAWKKGETHGLHFIVLDEDSRGYIREYVKNQKNKFQQALSN